MSLAARIARARFSRGAGPLAARVLARRFPARAQVRVLVFHHPNRIAWSQIYPFLHYAGAFAARHGAAIRCRPFAELLAGDFSGHEGADLILLQPWFTITAADLARAVARLRARWPSARLGFLDCFAHNDLRLARHLPDDLACYLKKSLFRDRADYDRAWRGDTNLTEFYSDLHGIPAEPVDFAPPAGFATKLRLGPGFFTAPHFIGGFAGPPPPQAGRRLDMQTRLGMTGSPWYTAMRRAALAAAAAVPGLSVSPPGIVPHRVYMEEMRTSRLCFSPFGYGELCWRDIEAFQAGAVLIKPDMGHLETLPDLYEPGLTYLPVRWDFADLAEVVRRALSDEALRSRIAAEAHATVARYIAAARFVDDMGFLFEG